MPTVQLDKAQTLRSGKAVSDNGFGMFRTLPSTSLLNRENIIIPQIYYFWTSLDTIKNHAYRYEAWFLILLHVADFGNMHQ